MYVAYFDEVKPSADNGHQYLVGGIIVSMSDIAQIEAQITELSERIFGSSELTQETEFHAKFLYHRKGLFKEMEAEERLGIFKQLAEIISNKEKSKKYGRVSTPKNSIKVSIRLKKPLCITSSA